MKKSKILLFIGCLTSTLMATDLTIAQLDKIKSETKILQNPSLKVVKGQDLDTVYFLQIKAKGPRGSSKKLEGFVDKKTGAIYLGGGYDKAGKKFSFPIDLNKIKESVAFSFGEGKEDLYIFTDPECPFCKKFEKESEGKLSKYKKHIILMPLSFHKNAKKMSTYILAGKDNTEKAHRFKEILVGEDLSYKEAKLDKSILTNYLLKSNQAVTEMDVKGTPTFFISDGNGGLRKIGWQQLLPKK